MQARRNMHLIAEFIFVSKWYKKLILTILVIVVNLSLFLQLRTSVHTDCNALTQQHPLITMWENSGRKKNHTLA